MCLKYLNTNRYRDLSRSIFGENPYPERICYGDGFFNELELLVEEPIATEITAFRNENASYAQAAFSLDFLPPETTALLLIGKFLHHLPIRHMVEQLNKHGSFLNVAEVFHYLHAIGSILGGLIRIMRRDMLGSPVMIMDEINVLCTIEKRSFFNTNQLWAAVGYWERRPICNLVYFSGMYGSYTDLYIGDFRGYLQTDSYLGFAYTAPWADIVLVSCIARMRARFSKIYEASRRTSITGEVIELIDKIYEIDEKLYDAWMEREISEAEFIASRREQVIPALAAFKDWLYENYPLVNHQSELGYAIAYAKKFFERSAHFIEHPLLRPQTSLMGSMLKNFYGDRCPWPFAPSSYGASASTCFYSIIKTAIANGHEPFLYMNWLVEQIVKMKPGVDMAYLLPYRTIDLPSFTGYETHPFLWTPFP